MQCSPRGLENNELPTWETRSGLDLGIRIPSKVNTPLDMAIMPTVMMTVMTMEMVMMIMMALAMIMMFCFLSVMMTMTMMMYTWNSLVAHGRMVTSSHQ